MKTSESIGSDPWGTKFYLAFAAVEIIKRYYYQEPGMGMWLCLVWYIFFWNGDSILQMKVPRS